MKRLHVHIGVSDIPASVAFYAKLFGEAPTTQENDYAKWMLEDPRVNFAISARAKHRGVDHLGLQTDDEVELTQLRDRLKSGDVAMWHEGQVQCCYAESEKSWAQDPDGVAWEAFTTMDTVNTYYGDSPKTCDPR
ncbi:MAG: VOC family protein [Pseudomonadota bacterium]